MLTLTQHGLFTFVSQHCSSLLLLQQSLCGQQFVQHGLLHASQFTLWHSQLLTFGQQVLQHALDCWHVLQLTDEHSQVFGRQQELQHALELEQVLQFIEVHLDSGQPVATTVFGHWLVRHEE
jgi:hypothetical protein